MPIYAHCPNINMIRANFENIRTQSPIVANNSLTFVAKSTFLWAQFPI